MSKFLKRTGIFLQVRMNSKRMPGKALMKLCGKPIVLHAIERLNIIPAEIRAVLTTKDSESYIKPLAEKAGWQVFVGDDQNVLKRFVNAALFYKVDAVVRATADNPLVSSEIASETLDIFNKKQCDLAYLQPIPYGSGVEVISTNALVKALDNTNIPYDLEHVTPYIYSHKDKFKIICSKFHDEEVGRSDIRLSIDTMDDFERMNYLFKNLEKKSNNLKIKSVINIFDELNFKKYKNILFITAYSESYGLGHFKRIIYIVSKLNKKFNIFFSFKKGDNKILENHSELKIKNIKYNNLIDHVNNNGLFERVIVDLRDTSNSEMQFYKKLGPVISIDDMGPGGQISDVNIKMLPITDDFKNLKFNFDGIEYLFTQVTKHKDKLPINNPPKNILISFGGSDPSKLTEPVAAALKKLKYKLTIIKGPYFNEDLSNLENVVILSNISNLEELIKKSDIIITSFGMTLFESIVLEKPVIIVNPSDYHEKLTFELEYPYFIKREQAEITESLYQMKFKEIIEKMKNDSIFDINDDNNVLNKIYSLPISKKIKNIINFISEWVPLKPVCPFCSNINDQVLYRNENYNMIKCKKCSLIYIQTLRNDNNEYENNYFIEEYKKQYGKTYEEDKKNILNLAKNRYKIITSYISSGRLLDFGSGLGFFSEYCEKNGFNTTSIDISKYAVNYMKNKLDLNSINSDSKYLEKSNELFDVITSFYVVEHIKDFQKLMFLFSLHLKKYGVIGLATPNADGISIKKHFEKYIQKHPVDHYNIFSPKFIIKLLKKFGFGNFKINITGIHPERFIKSEKLLNNKFIVKIIILYAKIFKLGDTFEIFAQKID